MPIVPSTYNPPLLFKNGHIATLYAGVVRKVIDIMQQRERIALPDGDFLDLDWSFSTKPTHKVVVLLHGLEGSAQRPYITGSAKQCNFTGYDACAVNFRSCSGETNNLFRSYHSGATEDLESVVRFILENKIYDEIYLIGFSLGGNLMLKYLGEDRVLPKEIVAAVAISVPCNLYSSLLELLKPKNMLYARRFKQHLVAKLRQKQLRFPDKIATAAIEGIRTLKDFDDVYTSKAHGFKDALDYYEQCSCLPFLPHIGVPTLIINAKNDSFLGAPCYPIYEAQTNDKLYLEMPRFGGHVGFWDSGNLYYSEKRSLLFIEEMG